MSTSGGLTGVGFPTYSGAGNPEGVQTGAVGESYVDTTNGALYWKIAGAGNTGWQLVGAGDGTVPGVMALNGSIYVMAPTNHRVIIGDAASWSGQGNGFSYVSTTVDGNQRVEINLGSADQFSWVFAAAGTTTFPGTVTITGKVQATAGLGVGNSAAATTPGNVVKKMEVFNAAGASLGFVAIYDAIT